MYVAKFLVRRYTHLLFLILLLKANFSIYSVQSNLKII